VDHSRQTGRPPLPTPRFRTVDGWGRPASARATHSRSRSGLGTRMASAAVALRGITSSADCTVRRSKQKSTEGWNNGKENMQRVSRKSSPSLAIVPLPYSSCSYAQGSVARSMAQPRYWVIISAARSQ